MNSGTPPFAAENASRNFKTFTINPIFADATTIAPCTLPVANDREYPVRFTKITPSCTCTSARLSKLDLAPGEKTELILELDLRGKFGPQRFTCRLQRDNGEEWVVDIETNAYCRARFEPETIRLGTVEPLARRELDFEHQSYAAGETPSFEPAELESMSSLCRIETQAPRVERLPDGIWRRTIPAHLRFDGPADATSRNVEIRARSANGDLTALQVSWTTRSLFEVRPLRVVFSGAAGNEPGRERIVRLRRVDGQPIVVRSLECGGNRFAAVANAKPSNEIELVVTLDGERFVDSWVEELTVVTDHPKQPTIRIPVAFVSSR